MDIALAIDDSSDEYESNKGATHIATTPTKTPISSSTMTQTSVVTTRPQSSTSGAVTSSSLVNEQKPLPRSLHSTPLPTLTPTPVLAREHSSTHSSSGNAASVNPAIAHPAAPTPLHIERAALPDPVIYPQSASASDVHAAASPENPTTLPKQSPDDLAAVFFGEDVLSSAKTRVFLPNPGSQASPSRPEDFLSPTFQSTVVSKPFTASETRVYEPTLEDFQKLASAVAPPPEMHLNHLGDVETFESRTPEYSVDSLAAPSIPTPLVPPSSAGAVRAPVSLGKHTDFESWMDQRGEGSVITAPSSPQTFTPASDLTEAVRSEPPSLPLDTGLSLHEGNFGTLLATQRPTLPPELPQSPQLPTSPSLESSSFLNPSSLSAEQDEEDDPKSSRTTLIMLISIVAVALLMGIGMIFVINSMLGGLSPGEAYREPADDAGTAANAQKVDLPRVPTSKATESAPNLSEGEDAKAKSDPPAIHREGASGTVDAPAVSFDEKVQQTMTGTRQGSVIGAPTLDSVKANPLAQTSPPTTASGPSANSTTPEPPVQPAMPENSNADAIAASLLPQRPETPATTAAAPASQSAALPQKEENYNPAASFSAPSPGDKSLGKTHDVVDAFLRAPDWQTQSKYAYHGESLRPTMEDYYKKWPYRNMGRYAINFFTSESDPSLGGPFWVFTISSGEVDSGFPLIVRVEDGNLKVDWDIFSEFFDRRYLRFREASMPEPATFRVVLEQLSDYYGSDRDQIKDLSDYLVYNVSMPYGGDGEFSDAAFVKKDSEVAKELSKIMKLGEDPLAVTITLEKRAFDHGTKHFIITKLFPEGWIQDTHGGRN